MKREIIMAPNSGFCFGVTQALAKAEKAADEVKDRKLYTCGQLIHNTMVTDRLAAKGAAVIKRPEDAEEGSVIIVRSHGEPKRFYDTAAERHLEVIDATCPFVARIHKLVHDAHESGKQIVIVGTADHPEAMGINGWCGDSAVVVKDGDDPKLSDIPKDGDLFVVAQTTLRKESLDEVTKFLSEGGYHYRIENTICSATEERQKGCMETAQKVDLMLVVGDKKSSNTGKLFEIAQKYCKSACFIENIEDLPLQELDKYNKIGVAAGASTPDYAIKEVITNMSDNITENTTNEEEMSMADVMDEIDKSLRLPRAGELVTGKILQVRDKEIIVNLGCKKDGIIPINEISLEGDTKLEDQFKEGDEIQAKVLKTDDGDGTILLSKKKLEVSEHWNEITKALEDKTTIDVQVVRKVNGGVIANYKEVSGFIPLSQLSDRFVEDAAEFVGQTLTVKVSRVDPRRGKAVFSHKAHLNDERQKALKQIWENIHVDDIVEGTVMRFTDYGAFVDIGGIDGLLHISEISWGKLKHPQEVLSIGQKISVKILSMNAEKGKISLGLKQTTPEPWSVIDENYHVGEVVKGKVVQIKEYGCFVELEPGLDGLVHISEVRHRRVGNINEELSIGDHVDAKILEIDKDRRRISLSIKETLDDNDEPLIKAEEPAEEPAAEEPAEEVVEEPAAEAVEETAAPAEEEAPAEDEQ